MMWLAAPSEVADPEPSTWDLHLALERRAADVFETYEAAVMFAKSNSLTTRYGVFKLVEVATFKGMRHEGVSNSGRGGQTSPEPPRAA